jgi:DNA segregation ATPase FtsK/SpoIIIE-like protein
MKDRLKFTFLVLLALATGLSSCKENPPPQPKAEAKKAPEAEPEPAVVGRITFMEKNVFRYLRDARDWALAMVDVPVGDGDILYSDVQGRSELTFPNDTKLRLNDKTKIQLDGVNGNLTSLFVNSGVARIQNRSADTVVKVDTPYGQVLSKQPSTFDVYVGDSSVAVTAINEAVRFVDAKGNNYDIKPGSDSLLANDNAVVSSRRFLDSKWDSWNNERDSESKMWENNPSPYLPAQLKSETQVLADNGNWEELSYDGETAHYWTPRNVTPDWSPFTVGQWTSWSGEQLWVPYERFGWVTHHHGGWIHHNNHWYWRPPVAGRWRYVPWYPARVAWVHSGRHIGWVPISPYEVYYGRRYWGPRTVIYNDHIRNVDIRRYVNINRVVVVEKDRLYGVHRRYETTRDVTVIKNVVNNGRAAPVVTREVVQGANLKMEHHFARSGDLSRKPNVDAANEFAARRRGSGGGTENAQAVTPGIQKASAKAPLAGTGQPPPVAKPGDENKRNLPETPRELRREQRQEKRLEANKERSTKEASGPQQLQRQQKQQQIVERQQQQQQPHQDAQQQRRQQQFERHQQQQQLGQEQQQALRQQQQAQRQQQLQAQQQQQQLAHQQQAAQRQQQLQAQQQQQQLQHQQQQQGQQRQSQRQAHQKQPQQ